MALSLSASILVGTGALVLALGLAVWIMRPRSPAARWLGAFCVGHGSSVAIAAATSSYNTGAPNTARDALLIIPVVLFAAGCLGIALAVPGAIPREARSRIIVPGAAVGVAMGVTLFILIESLGYRSWGGALNILQNTALFFVFIVLPLRYAGTAPAEAPTRRTLGLIGIGIGLLVGGEGGDLMTAVRTGALLPFELIYTGGLLIGALLWLRATRGPDAKLARNNAIVIPAALLVSMLVPSADRAAFYAPGYLASALFLAYAVMRGQIDGLDVKVRLALSKSTIAAVFIAVFFLASELAQQFFGAQFGAYGGIIAAGMLVFAIAPLQRAAERMAEKAVPVATTTTNVRVADTTQTNVYRDTVRRFLRDGAITRDEERTLAHLAAELGIDARAAFQVREDAEREREAR